MIDQQAEQLERGRIDPVQVFHNKEHWLLGSDPQQDGQEGVQGLLFLLRGRPGERGIGGGQRQGEERGKEGHSLRQRQTILRQVPLQFAELLLGGLLPLEA